MTIIILLMLSGFVVMFTLAFGVQFSRFGTFQGSFTELFLWVCGDYNVDDLMAYTAIYFYVLFPIFLSLFLLLTTMFLAAVVFKWKQTRREARDPSVVNELLRLYEGLFPREFEDESDNVRTATKMDKAYWQKCSILTKLPLLEESW